jgi:N12 class adenine-specific DNA methylase
LEIIFENNFSCVRKRHFDGSFLNFPGMSPSVQLYPYQKDAVARILFSPNTLLAHDVGSGKTFIMIAAGMELRRMGLSQKNLYVVPNNLVGQWRNIFLQLYPQAKLLCIEPKNFTPAKRDNMLMTIRGKDFDGIIMAYSCFEQIEISRDVCIQELEKARDELKKLLKNHRNTTQALRNREKKINKALQEAITSVIKSDTSVFFDELGITRLFVDEAHNFKNVPIETKVTKVLGISSGGSKKCKDMMDKVHLLQSRNGGGGVVMATGTPITNSITDAYIMQMYLQSGELAMLDLQSFDSRSEERRCRERVSSPV